MPEFVDGNSGALEETEEGELGGAAVPDADEEECDEEAEDAEVGLQGDIGDAAHQCDEEGIVDVSFEPVGEGDVPAGPEIEEGGSGEGTVEVFREAYAHESRECDDDVNVAGEVAIEEEGIEEGEFEGGEKFEGEREVGMELSQRVLLKSVEEHGEDVDFEEAEDDALELDADDVGAERDGGGGELVACEIVVELYGAGDEGGEVECVKEVLEEVDGLLIGGFGAVDEEVQDAEEDVGEAEGEVGEVEEGGFGEEGVLFEPDVDEDDGEEGDEEGFWELFLDEEQAEIAEEQESGEGEEDDAGLEERGVGEEGDEDEAREHEDGGAPDARAAEVDEERDGETEEDELE